MVRFILFFLALCFLIACSGNPSPEKDPKGFEFYDVDFSWPTLPNTEEYVWTNLKTFYGFLPHNEHSYGFDKHPNPYNRNSEDSITHISVRSNAEGIVNIFVDPEIYNSNAGYIYGLCDLKTKKMIDTITSFDKKGFYEHIFLGKTAGNVDSIGLCKKLEASKESSYTIFDKLRIHSYDIRYESILLYSLGSDNTFERFIKSKQVWEDAFHSVYRQANLQLGLFSIISQNTIGEVTHLVGDSIVGQTNVRKLSVHVKNDSSSCYQNVKDDIDVAIDSVKYAAERKGMSKVVLAVIAPTRKMWALTTDKKGFIQVCGKPEISPEDVSEIQLYSPMSVGARYTPNDVIRRDGSVWVHVANNDTLKEGDFDLNEMVFIESSATTSGVNTYLGSHLSDGAVAETFFLGGLGQNPYDMSYVLLSWKEEYTGRALFHELGHTFGLIDVRDTLLDEETIKKSSEGNLMHSDNSLIGVKLRNRPMRGKRNSPYNDKYETQWDCLQRINTRQSCADSSIIYFNFGE